MHKINALYFKILFISYCNESENLTKNMKYIIKDLKIVVVVLSFILLGFMATNPSLEDHREEVLKQVKKKINEPDKSSSNEWEKTGTKLGIAMAEGLVNNAVKRRNGFLLSATVVEFNGVQKVIGIGILGHVWVDTDLYNEILNN